jgi:hypothetical protein
LASSAAVLLLVFPFSVWLLVQLALSLLVLASGTSLVHLLGLPAVLRLQPCCSVRILVGGEATFVVLTA